MSFAMHATGLSDHATTSAVRRPPVFGAAQLPTCSSSSSPFGAWGVVTPTGFPAVRTAATTAATNPFGAANHAVARSFSANPFSVQSATTTTTAVAAASGGVHSGFRWNSPSVGGHSVSAHTAVSTSFGVGRSVCNTSSNGSFADVNAIDATVSATTGWFPLRAAPVTPPTSVRPNVFGVVPRVGTARNPFGTTSGVAVTPPLMSFGTFGANRTVAGVDSRSNARLPLVAASLSHVSEANPFGPVRRDSSSNVSQPSSTLSSPWFTHVPQTQALRTEHATSSLNVFRNTQVVEPTISFTTGAWQSRPPLPNNGTAVTSSSEGAVSASAGFRFTVTPSWTPSPRSNSAPQVPLSSALASNSTSLPAPRANRFSNCLPLNAATTSPLSFTHQPSAGCTVSYDIDASTRASLLQHTTSVPGFDVTLPKAASSLCASPSPLPSSPHHLIALPDASPYGKDAFGFGRMESAVKAALSFQQTCSKAANFLDAKPKPMRKHMRTTVGLPTQPLFCATITPVRQQQIVGGQRSVWRPALPPRRLSTRRAFTPQRVSHVAKFATATSRAFRFQSSLLQAASASSARDAVSKAALASLDSADEKAAGSLNVALDETNAPSETPLNSESVVCDDDVLAALESDPAPVDPQPVEAKLEVTHEPATNSACPILTMSHMSTIPEYALLQRMSSADLAQVNGFAVRSEEFGEIEWPGLTDVRHLNLDDILLFSDNEVVVYPDESCVDKPAVGFGLNKRAILRLRGIIASDGNRRVTATESSDADDDEAATVAFVERLRQRTAALRATFLSYEPIGGVWSFQVEHF